MFINKNTPKNYVISLGGGWDIKLFLINKYFPKQKTEFFDNIFYKGLPNYDHTKVNSEMNRIYSKYF